MNPQDVYYYLADKNLICTNGLLDGVPNLFLRRPNPMGNSTVLVERYKGNSITILTMNWELPDSYIELNKTSKVLSLDCTDKGVAITDKAYKVLSHKYTTKVVGITNMADTFPLILTKEDNSIVAGIVDSSGEIKNHRRIFRIQDGRLIFYRNIDSKLGLPFVTKRGTVRYRWTDNSTWKSWIVRH